MTEPAPAAASAFEPVPPQGRQVVIVSALVTPLFGRRARCDRRWRRRAGTLVAMIVAAFAQSAAPLVAPWSGTWGRAIVVVAIVLAARDALRAGGPVDRLVAVLRRRRLRKHPLDPWNADHRWNPSGETRHVTSDFAERFGFANVLTLVVLLCLIASPLMPAVALAVLGLSVTWWIWGTWQVWWRGRPHVAFTQFPYFVGDRVELHFGMSDDGADFRRVRYVLRRIQEFGEAGNRYRIVCLQTWRAEFELPRTVQPGPGVDVRLVFDVPDDAGGSAVSETFPSYWELEVTGDTTKGVFQERFLIPIYERPAGAAA